jgi:branched-chain amino acid transport system ATP-binding protein
MLELDAIRMSYGAVEAVKGVSLTVRRGEVVTLIGANGAGKSTLLKGIVGLHPLDGGRVLVNGADCASVPSHGRVGLGMALSPEGRGVFADQTVRDNLVLGAFAQRSDGAKCKALLDREFARFPRLKERETQFAGTLSGGEQQMLAISRALMSDPKLLLLDEPSLGLAPRIIGDIFRTIRELRDTGLTILLVEQMANQALAIADRAYVLETGKVTCEGTGAELLRDPKVRAAYLGAH